MSEGRTARLGGTKTVMALRKVRLQGHTPTSLLPAQLGRNVVPITRVTLPLGASLVLIFFTAHPVVVSGMLLALLAGVAKSAAT